MGKKAVQSLRTPISIYGRRVRYAVLEFKELLDSSSIEAKGWAEIASTVGRNYELFDGFVVLHGTDSLAYTSSALSFMLQNLGKPVILTGSQLPMLELQSDGTDNLLGSLVIAGHFMIPEVCLYFNNRLLRGNRATKVSATDFDAFDSRNCGPLAEVESQRTRVHWERIVKPCAVNGFAVRAQADTAHVACLRIFPGIRPAMVDAVLRLDGLRGLVLETFGTGNTPDGPGSALTAALTEAIGRGLVVVSVTQCLHGSVSSGYAPARALARAGVALGMDMTTEAALTKLAYLLAQHGDGAAAPARVADMMSRSLRGELTEAAPTAFQHPTPPPGADSTATAAAAKLSAHATDLTALAYAIGDGNLDKVRDAVKGEPQHLLNAADYSGNTPLVSV